MHTLIEFILDPHIVRFWIIPLTVTLLVPRFLFAVYLGWVVLVALILFTWLGEVAPRENGVAMIFAYAFFMAAAVGTALGAVIKLVFFAAVRRRAGERPRYQSLLRRGFAWALAAAVALRVAWRIYLEAGWAWHGFRPAWLLHGVLLGFILAAAVIAWAVFRFLRMRWRSSWKTGLQVFVWSLCGMLLAFLIAGALLPILVLERAQAIAGDRPFCIQTTNGNRRSGSNQEYLPAGSMLDLSGLTMQAAFHEGWFWQNHAVLIVADGPARLVFHWSCWNRDFMPDIGRQSPALCQPVQDFAPLWLASD